VSPYTSSLSVWSFFILFLLNPLVVLTARGGAPVLADGLIASPEPDWPQWRGPRRDGISSEKGLLPNWPPDGPRLLWKKEGLGTGWSSPIVVGQRLYVTGDVGDHLVIHALDLDGKLAWQVKNGKAWTGSYPGARASCAFSEGQLYHLNAHGRVICLDAASGREIWFVDILERFAARNITWALSESLLIDGPRLIVTPGGPKTLMAALDKTTGKTLWATKPIPGELASYSSPILFRHGGRRLLANCSSSHGFGVDADRGTLLWTVPLHNQFDVNVSTPIYGAGCLFYVTAYDRGACYRLRSAPEGVKVEDAWTSSLDTVTGSGVFLNGSLFISGYRKSKFWMCVDWHSGDTRYQFKDLTTGAALVAEDRLYCLAEDGRAALLQPTPNGFQLAGQFRLVPKRVNDAWAHPVLHQGKLYLRYHNSLWCYDVANSPRAE
jgi:outer membrane protein assembly factor BamB